MDRASTTKRSQPWPTLRYTPPRGYLPNFKPSFIMGMVKEVADVDLWKGYGLAMRARIKFAEWCHMVAPEWCIVQNRKAVIMEASRWTKLHNQDVNYNQVKLKWQASLEDQVNLIKLDVWMTRSASEVIFDILDDPGTTANASTEDKERFALCMIYAIWKEGDEITENDTDDISEKIRTFADYIRKGQGDDTEKYDSSYSPWFAVYWILTQSNFKVDAIHNDKLKRGVSALAEDIRINTEKYLSKNKRESENAYVLSQLKSELPPDPAEYEKLEGHDPDLLNLVYNIHGVEYWGVCLDRAHLVNSTVNSVLSKAIQQAKKDMGKIAKEKLGDELLKDPQAYARQKLEDAERVLIKTGISQISESLEDEFSKVFSTTHMAEGAAPLALSILIRSEMLKWSAENSPSQLRFIMPAIINSISPLLLASAVRITHGAIKVVQRLQAVPQLQAELQLQAEPQNQTKPQAVTAAPQ